MNLKSSSLCSGSHPQAFLCNCLGCRELIACFQIKTQPPEEHQKASCCCQTQTRSFDKLFFSCWCWHMQSLFPKPLFLQVGHLSACWYNCWCSFAVNQMRELLCEKIIQLKETLFCLMTAVLAQYLGLSEDKENSRKLWTTLLPKEMLKL